MIYQFNITADVIAYSVSSIPLFIITVILFYHYTKSRHNYLRYMALMWFFLFLWCVSQIFSFLTLSHTIFRYSLFFFTPISICLIFIDDSMARQSVDPLKLIFIIVISTASFIFSYSPGAITETSFRNGELTLTAEGNYRISLGILLISMTWMYFSIIGKISFKAPKKLQKYAYLNFIVSIIIVISIPLLYFFQIYHFIPGIDGILISILGIIGSYTFSYHPELAYILPFKVYTLIVFDSKSGLPIYSHTWKTDEKELLDVPLSGVINAIGNLLKDTVRKGMVKEIKFEEATLIFHENDQYPLACALLTTKNVSTLQKALISFYNDFIQEFNDDLSNLNEISKFESASELIQKNFGFVPTFD